MAIVHSFERWDGSRMVWSKYKMTVEALARDSSLVKVNYTEEEVPDSALDSAGRYLPVG
jgi:hypothetical protein